VFGVVIQPFRKRWSFNGTIVVSGSTIPEKQALQLNECSQWLNHYCNTGALTELVFSVAYLFCTAILMDAPIYYNSKHVTLHFSYLLSRTIFSFGKTAI
jgi:hypothetical protein